MVSGFSFAREEIEKLYDATMSVTEYISQKDQSTKRMVITEVSPEGKQNIPCRLSFNAFPSAGDGEVSVVQFYGKVFCSPEIQILPGSKITITQNGATYIVKSVVAIDYSINSIPYCVPIHSS